MSKSVIATKKPYCKVCYDAGKSESEYTNHWVKDLTGKTTCPTLLQTECRWCFKAGHIAKFCKELEKVNKEKKRADKEKERIANKVIVKPIEKMVKNKHTNTFNSLCESDSETEPETDPDDEYPPVAPKIPSKPKMEIKTGWAAIVSKPVEVKRIEEPTKKTGLVLLSDFIDEKKVIEVRKNQVDWKNSEVKKEVAKRSWADWSDSEDDEDVFDEEKYDEDLKWKNTFAPGMPDTVWNGICDEYDNTW